jgi:hypothetical protein
MDFSAVLVIAGRNVPKQFSGFPVDIPYRLDSIEAINTAKREDFLNLGKGYNLMLVAARNGDLHYPQAFRKAKKSVKKDFTVIDEEVICKIDVRYEEISDLDLAGNLERIEGKIPWLRDMARHESAFGYIETFPPDVRKGLGVERTPPTPTQMLEAHLALRHLIKREILHYVKTGRTKSVDLEYLKQLMTAMSLFDSPQQEILHLLKTGEATGDFQVPYQNILAEMLFARLPQTMGNLVMANPLALRQKLFARIGRLDITVRQRMTLCGYCQHILNPQQLTDALGKMKQISARMSLTPETKRSLNDYLDSLKSHLEKISQVYREWFLDRDLEIIKKLHAPSHWLKVKRYADKLVKTCTHLVTLELYPTKDFLDICKGVVSGDCVTEVLGENHLRESRYFSIRIFMDRKWVGNIYMLDFTDTRGILLVDRIQIPRNLRVLYHRFFDYLREVFEELFVDVPYESIIMPKTISNHKNLQKTFNIYRKNLPSVAVDFGNTETKNFESTNRRQRYHVLASKAKAA